MSSDTDEKKSKYRRLSHSITMRAFRSTKTRLTRNIDA